MSREVGGRAVGTSKGPRDQDGETISRAARVFLVRRGMGLGWCWFLASVDGFERVIGDGDWELGMDEPDQESRAPGEWTADSGQRHQASRTGDGGPWTWRARAHWAPGIQWGGRVRESSMRWRSTNQEMRQSRKQAPGNPTLSGKQSATTTTTETRLRHTMCYFRAGALGMVSPRFSPLKKKMEGDSPLRLLLLEVPLLSSSCLAPPADLHRDRTHPPSPFSTTPMLASATSERGDCHLGQSTKSPSHGGEEAH